MVQLYQHQPLEDLDHVRLVELLPGHQDDELQMRIQHVNLSDPIEYEAVSYAWGDPNGKVAVTCDREGSLMMRTRNCASVLRALREPKRDGLHEFDGELQHSGSPRLLWIDAICINQADTIERSLQVESWRLYIIEPLKCESTLAKERVIVMPRLTRSTIS
jgi:hypothetical protein